MDCPICRKPIDCEPPWRRPEYGIGTHMAIEHREKDGTGWRCPCGALLRPETVSQPGTDVQHIRTCPIWSAAMAPEAELERRNASYLASLDRPGGVPVKRS